MSKVENAVNFAINIAYDNSYGYDQNNRWGPDYDCSSLVIQAFQNAGIPVKSNGATYTGNMKEVFTRCGFNDVTGSVNLSNGAGLQYGDVLLNEVHHTAIYIGDGQLVHASINEKGKAVGGQSGDQTGREICVRNYYNYPWDCVLRYSEDTLPAPQPQGIDWEGLHRFVVAQGQEWANKFVGHDEIAVDGVVGPATRRMKVRVIQHAMNLDYCGPNAYVKRCYDEPLVEDGLWGSKTEAALASHYIEKDETQYMVTAMEIFVLIAGNNPNGVEMPGIFGEGLKSALNTDYCDRNLLKFCALC